MGRLRLGVDPALCWSGAAGLLLAWAFPRPSLALLAWAALVPLLLVMERRPFKSGFVAGVLFFGVTLYWLNIVMVTYGRLHPVLSVVAYLLLVGYLALFFGASTWAACRINEKLGLSVVVTLPVVWTALEFVRSFLLSGFPWASLGYSQIEVLPLVQSADLFGVYGLTYLLLLVNCVLAALVRAWRGRRFDQIPRVACAVAGALVLGNLAYGQYRLQGDLDHREQALSVGLIQGNIDQAEKWDPARQGATLDAYGSLSRRASAQTDLDLVIWPEAATPFYFQEPTPAREEVVKVPRATDAYLLFGSPAYRSVNRTYRYLNSAYLLSPAGEVLGRSDKIHLVPFGEYVPFGRFLPFIDKLVVGIGDFSPGTVSPLPMNGASLGVLVCYEAIFPELARAYVRQGISLLVNITNDAWFGRSSAPYQHLAMTRMRAIENRIWIARAANTGISAFIAPSGRISARTPIFETTLLTGRVGLGSEPTLYNRIGDVVPALFAALTLWWLVRTRRRPAK